MLFARYEDRTLEPQAEELMVHRLPDRDVLSTRVEVLLGDGPVEHEVPRDLFFVRPTLISNSRRISAAMLDQGCPSALCTVYSIFGDCTYHHGSFLACPQ